MRRLRPLLGLAALTCAAAATPAPAPAAAQAGSLALDRYPAGDGVPVPARVFVAPGPGPHPTLLLLHGFPGSELNFDLAHEARRAGWNVVVPHYRGSWGSPGRFSWQGVLDDAAAAVRWVRAPEFAARYRGDPERVAVAGHSLGGFAALRLAAQDRGLLGAASLAGFNFGAHTAAAPAGAAAEAQTAAAWAGAASFLAGTTGPALAREAFARGAAWDLRGQAARLAAAPLLLVAAARDGVAPPALHHAPLAAALRAAGSRHLTEVVLDADHGFVDARPELAAALLEWLGGRAAASRVAGLGAPGRRRAVFRTCDRSSPHRTGDERCRT